MPISIQYIYYLFFYVYGAFLNLFLWQRAIAFMCNQGNFVNSIILDKLFGSFKMLVYVYIYRYDCEVEGKQSLI